MDTKQFLKLFNQIKMMKTMAYLRPSLQLFVLLLVIISIQSKLVSSVNRENENKVPRHVDSLNNIARDRERRSYYWVEDGSDKVTIIESEGLKRTLENYRHKEHRQHNAEKRHEEYIEDEHIQEHTPLFVPNLFG